MSLINRAEDYVSMTIYSLLKGEHAEVKALLNALQATPDLMDDSKMTLFEKVKRELLSHAHAEQATVYDRVEARITKADVEEARQEHEEIEQRLYSLASLEVTSEAWDDELKRLIEAVDDHVEEEEDVLFEEMKTMFSEEEAKEMAKQFHEAKNRELQAMA